MIETISIADTSTFGNVPESLTGLSQFNFLFGGNGVGKTTISRVVADEGAHPACKVTWKGGTRLQCLVYNRDFIEKNFNQSAELKGVFTLGEKNVGTLAKISGVKGEIDKLNGEIETLTETLQGKDGNGGKKGELSAVESTFKDKCWSQKQKHDEKLQGAFEGYRNSSERFKGNIIKELGSNKSDLLPLADLEKRAATVFGPTPTQEKALLSLDASALLSHEKNPILKKRVIGKEDVDIAAMIKKLGNSDWVREGRTYFAANQGVCPFCQQQTSDKFAKQIEAYFDDAFLADSKAIDDLVTNYTTDTERLQGQIGLIIGTPTKFLDVEKLKKEKELLDSKFILNLQRLAAKKKEPSRVVELESVANVVATLKKLIDDANGLIAEHNRMVANLAQERTLLTSQVWKFVLEELKADIAAYEKDQGAANKAIVALNGKIETAKKDKKSKSAELRELEKQTTSVQPTIDGINSLLASFGFSSFSLAKAGTGSSYKLIRANGSDAKATLSEGEKTFVTFLYFYHLLKGSETESGMTTDRVVVFDDPVSSLDSDILFVVGSLIKGLFEEVREGKGHIKQIFIFTHNVYFHKEITFNPKRTNNAAMNEETFWVLRKSGQVSKIEGHKSNPIKTTYELLWTEVRKPDPSSLTIQNTLRRILENYFKILGGVDPDQICSMFQGKEKLICKSLFSWVNDGSHYAHDDIHITIDHGMVEAYLKVFKAIFEKSGHLAHYKMMMGDAFVDDSLVAVASVPAQN